MGDSKTPQTVLGGADGHSRLAIGLGETPKRGIGFATKASGREDSRYPNKNIYNEWHFARRLSEISHALNNFHSVFWRTIFGQKSDC